ncbi:MAG: helix-turn-helix domain-containing protein [Oscillospiraceae bacterium]|nr:helix-turn-helix domain-containing protein [Oscillospiraceae bacterium]
MKVGAIGYNYVHDSDFEIDRPNGNGCRLMLLVKEPSIFEINGERLEVKKNSFVMFSPETSCKYRAADKYYTDDWMYYDADENDLEKFGKYGIKENTVYYLGNIEELSQIMHILAYEHYCADSFHVEIEEKYLDIFLLKLARMIEQRASASSEALIEKNYRFTQLRTRIFTMPETVPDVEGMAAEVGMSRSGFQHLYKKMFGVSVMSDVITGRLDRAKRLLSSTNLTIREIAERCGYESEFNFMRQFKSRYGQTPTEYRKCL